MQLSLSLFTDSHPELWQFWRDMLARWPRNVLAFRHHRGCTGWSMATQDFLYARLLFREGQISKSEFRRYFRLNRRVLRWEANQ